MPQDSSSLMSMWNFNPILFIVFLLVLSVYGWVMGIYRLRVYPPQPLHRAGVIYFLLSLIIIFLTQVSPLDMISEKYLLIAHMIYHLILTNIAAPLMVLGIPGWWISPIVRAPFWQSIRRFLPNPTLSFMIFNINLLMWHYPNLYEAAMANPAIHLLEYSSFMVTGLLFWWPIFSQSPELPRLPYPNQCLYLFLASIPCTILGVLFVFSPTVLYPTYVNAPRIFNIDAVTDQVVSGILMTTADNLFFLGVLSFVFFKWLNQDKTNNAVHSAS